MTAQIDVLMPTYNAGRFLPETLASIQAQTVRDIRIIVVNDGSTDNTAEILAQAAALDSRIHVITQANGGIVAALNTGLTACSAPIIARHDADDLSNPDRFERQMQFLEANTDCVAVSCLARHINEAGLPVGTITTLKDLATVNDSSIPAVEPYLLHPMLMLRKTAAEQAGGYRSVYNAEDSDLYWRLFAQDRMHILPEVLGSYRLHANSLTSSSIVSGRQSAVWSQLAALSAQRRRHGQPDLTFDQRFMTGMRSYVSLRDIYGFSRRYQTLTDEEQIWLASASSAKLMELTYYRPFEPEREDIAFVRESIGVDKKIHERSGYTVFEEGILSASIRMLISGRFRDAFIFVDRRAWPRLVARSIFRVVIPSGLKSRIKRLVRS